MLKSNCFMQSQLFHCLFGLSNAPLCDPVVPFVIHSTVVEVTQCAEMTGRVSGNVLDGICDLHADSNACHRPRALTVAGLSRQAHVKL